MAAQAACRHASLPLTNSTKADEQMSVNATSVTTLRLHMGSQKVGFVSDFQGSPFGAGVSCVCHSWLGRARTPAHHGIRLGTTMMVSASSAGNNILDLATHGAQLTRLPS